MELAEIFSNGFTNYYSQWWHRDESWRSSYSLNQRLSICNRNLNMTVHMYRKLSLLLAHISVHKFSIICLREAYLNFKTQSDDGNFKIH